MEKDLEILEEFRNNHLQRDKFEIDNRCGGFKMGKIYKLTELNPALQHLIQAYKEQQAELEKKDKIINKALEIAFQYAQIDGDHHKAWVIDQIVRRLTGEGYKEWVEHYEYDEETGDEYTWSEGIAP